MRPFTLFPSLENLIPTAYFTKFYLFYAILVFSTTIFSLIFSLILFSNSKEEIYPYFQLLDNWNQPFLLDIKSTYKDDCPQGYDRLFNYQWPGTAPGCDCRNARYYFPDERHQPLQKIIYRGNCKYNQTRSGCSEIKALHSKDFYKWREYQVLCEKRMTGTSFINNFPKYYDECPENSFRCGSKEKDSDNSFCVPILYEKCPISSLIVSRNKPGEEYNESLMLDQDEDLKLYWTRESVKLPISEFRINEEAVCFNNLELNKAYGNDHKLMVSTRVPCDKTDPRFQEIDRLYEKNFFKFNDMVYLEDVLPEFRFDPNVYWKIFTRSYIEFKLECRYMIKNLLSYQSNVKKIQNTNEDWMTLIVIFSIFSFIFNMIYTAFSCKRSSKSYIFQFIAGFFNYFARYFCLNYAWQVTESSKVFKELIKTMEIFECSDELTNSYFKMLRDEDVGSYVRIITNLITFAILVDILILCFSFILLKMNKGGVKVQ